MHFERARMKLQFVKALRIWMLAASNHLMKHLNPSKSRFANKCENEVSGLRYAAGEN